MVMISERPAEADDRAVPGHWEGDLIIGKDCKSAIGTLVERTTRDVLLLHLPDGRDAHLVEAAMRQAITALPDELARTITWDQGKEMAPTPTSPPPPTSRSTSATRTSPGSADPTKTPTACYASTCPKAPTYRCTPPPTSPALPAASTTGPVKHSDT
jgi:IS30 family transposase